MPPELWTPYRPSTELPLLRCSVLVRLWVLSETDESDHPQMLISDTSAWSRAARDPNGRMDRRQQLGVQHRRPYAGGRPPE